MTEETRMRGGQGLAEALEDHLDRWSRRTGIAVETWALPQGDVEPDVSRGVMAAFGEALANVERHSRARTVSVAVTLGASGLRMTVSDDGVGFYGTATGRGAALMRAAFAELGGVLTVHGVPGEGTTVTGVIPRR
ncbi:sensor histidine kinase [Spongiactinospora rosea]|uniref:sensor histidine kinase n=1 Tax=Spongiactinospora rosea TaxID=2248750 RepID=UPI001313D939|nr:ATP-binding protein [Spongiactinospora rosea]